MTYWQPHSYQREAAEFLLERKYAALFLDPGLGKTSTTLAVAKILKKRGLLDGILLIAPLRVIQLVWPGELSKWDNFKNLTFTTLHGKGKKSLWGPKKDIYLMNPEGLPWLYDTLLEGIRKKKKVPFDTLWIDESTKFKSPTAHTRFGLLKDMLSLFKRRYIMTGTPAPRGLMDLWSQVYILDKGDSLGDNFYKFRRKYFEAGYNGYSYDIRDGSSDKIHAAIAPFTLEMSSKDHLEMPPVTYNNIPVELAPKARKLYNTMEQEFFIEMDNTEASAMQQAQASMKCHQIANGRVYEDIPDTITDEKERRRYKRKAIFVHKQKISALVDLTDELAGKPILIAYQYRHDLAALKELFGDDVPHIGSGVPEQRAKEIEKDWNAGKLPVLLGHPASMGHGLNLQAAGNDICWYSATWNLEEYMQFNARIWRQGVSGSVRIHHIVANDTIDFAMMSRLGDKAKAQTDLRESLKQYRLARRNSK